MQLRSAGEALSVVPPAGVIRLLSPRRAAYSVVAPTLWISLPFEARLAPSLTSFCRCMKTAVLTSLLKTVGTIRVLREVLIRFSVFICLHAF